MLHRKCSLLFTIEFEDKFLMWKNEQTFHSKAREKNSKYDKRCNSSVNKIHWWKIECIESWTAVWCVSYMHFSHVAHSSMTYQTLFYFYFSQNIYTHFGNWPFDLIWLFQWISKKVVMSIRFFDHSMLDEMSTCRILKVLKSFLFFSFLVF